MTATELITKLINLGLVHTVGSEYFLTSKVSDLEAKAELKANLLVPVTVTELGDLYPEVIRNASPSNRLKAIFDYCKVPPLIVRSNTRFMVRSSDKYTKDAITRMLQNSYYKPKILLQCIEDYYTFIEYPKAFKKVLFDGDLHNLYEYYINGNSLADANKPDNKLWM